MRLDAAEKHLTAHNYRAISREHLTWQSTYIAGREVDPLSVDFYPTIEELKSNDTRLGTVEIRVEFCMLLLKTIRGFIEDLDKTKTEVFPTEMSQELQERISDHENEVL